MQLKFVLCMIKYKIKHKIVNCEKIESVTSHDLYPLPCHKLSHFLRPLPLGAWHTLWTAPKVGYIVLAIPLRFNAHNITNWWRHLISVSQCLNSIHKSFWYTLPYRKSITGGRYVCRYVGNIISMVGSCSAIRDRTIIAAKHTRNWTSVWRERALLHAYIVIARR